MSSVPERVATTCSIQERRGLLVPSKFLINKDRRIVWTYIGKDKTDRPSIDLMMEVIDTKLEIPVE